jgi:hypothetical protein
MHTDVVLFVMNSKRLGKALADTAYMMERHLGKEECPQIMMRVAVISDTAGNTYPIYLESSKDEYFLYGKNGAKRRILLHCERGLVGNFEVTGGEYSLEAESFEHFGL